MLATAFVSLLCNFFNLWAMGSFDFCCKKQDEKEIENESGDNEKKITAPLITTYELLDKSHSKEIEETPEVTKFDASADSSEENDE